MDLWKQDFAHMLFREAHGHVEVRLSFSSSHTFDAPIEVMPIFTGAESSLLFPHFRLPSDRDREKIHRTQELVEDLPGKVMSTVKSPLHTTGGLARKSTRLAGSCLTTISVRGIEIAKLTMAA